MQSIKGWLELHGIEEVECLIPDMTGNARGKLIPASKFVTQESRLPEAILLQGVNGVWTEEHEDLFRNAIDCDMLLQPDPATVRVVPWAKQGEPTAQIIHDCYTRNGELHPLAVRSVLKRVLDLYEKEGWQPMVAPEAEFYFVEQNTDPDLELKPPIGRNGRIERSGQSYSVDAMNQYEDVIDDMYAYCDAMNLDVDTLIHEDGAAQFEVNFVHGDPLDLADQVFIFKRTVREAALKHKMYATFMAKPMRTEPGSAMHIHQSIVDKKTGKNIFVDDEGKETHFFRHYIGGLQKYTPSAIAFYAPNVNSYRRFTKEIAAPVNLYWGYDNRTTGIRIPTSSPGDTRIENRFPGMDANPYLALAASLACGYLGMKNGIQPDDPYKDNAYDKDVAVARSLLEALNWLRESDEMATVMGDRFIRGYCAVKETEYKSFNEVISSWEREYLLLNV